MKILIDLTSLSRPITGIESYALNLARTLLAADKKNEYHLLFRKNIHKAFKPYANTSARLKFSLSTFSSQLLTEQLYIPWLVTTRYFDFVFFPCFPPGLFVAHKNLVFLCHDATMWKYPGTLSLKNKMYFKPLAKKAIRTAILVCTNSESSKTDILHFFPSLGERIVNIGAALADKYSEFDKSMIPTVLRKLKIDRRFLLSVSSLEPRKNIPFIIDSISEILQKEDLLLVLAGRPAWGRNAIDEAIARTNSSRRVISAGYVNQNELKSLYSAAEMFLFPSLYEGFGFPILEAFACGCPVITSNVSSMPSVAGEAAILVDPTNGKDLKDAIQSVLVNASMRKNLVSNGCEQLKKFSWATTCDSFIRALEKLTKQI